MGLPFQFDLKPLLFTLPIKIGGKKPDHKRVERTEAQLQFKIHEK